MTEECCGSDCRETEGQDESSVPATKMTPLAPKDNSILNEIINERDGDKLNALGYNLTISEECPQILRDRNCEVIVKFEVLYQKELKKITDNLCVDKGHTLLLIFLSTLGG